MPFELTIDPGRRVVTVTLRGAPTRDDILAAYERVLADAPSFSRLWDYRAADLARLAMHDLRALAAYAAAREGAAPPPRVATVVRDDLAFGIARAYGSWAQEHASERRIFRDPSEAMEWILSATPSAEAERPDPPDPEATPGSTRGTPASPGDPPPP